MTTNDAFEKSTGDGFCSNLGDGNKLRPVSESVDNGWDVEIAAAAKRKRERYEMVGHVVEDVGNRNDVATSV